MKVPLVLFSGGMDSTYLVSYMLAEDGPVDVLYVNGGQCPNKIAKELEARDKLIELMNQFYPNKIRNQYELLHPVYIHSGKSKKWIQPNAWMQGAFSVLDPEIHNEMRVAYVNDDGAYFGYHLNDLKKQWDAMQSVGIRGNFVPLEFATLHMSKMDIIEQIDKRLLPYVWVCELPKDGKSCQKCNPCKLMNRTLSEYKDRYGETVWRAVKRAERFDDSKCREEQRELSRKALTPYVELKPYKYDNFSCLPEVLLEMPLEEV